MFKNVRESKPDDSYECIVKVWNPYHPSLQTGIGYYDPKTDSWVIQPMPVDGRNPSYTVVWWMKVPDIQYVDIPENNWFVNNCSSTEQNINFKYTWQE